MIATRTDGPLRVEQDGAVLLLTLQRPDRANTLTAEMEREYRALLAAADADPDVRAVVVTGAGRAFCAGAEFDDLEALVADPSSNPFADPAFREPAATSTPLVAAINGGCAGIGLVEALYADVRFAADDARITTAFVRRGIVPEQGASVLLVRAVGEAHARDLLLSGRTIDGAEAARLGLVSRAVPRDELLALALTYAHDIAEHCAPRAVAAVKRDLHRLRRDAFETAATRDTEALAAAMRGPDFAEGVASAVQKRAPIFAGNGAGGVGGVEGQP